MAVKRIKKSMPGAKKTPAKWRKYRDTMSATIGRVALVISVSRGWRKWSASYETSSALVMRRGTLRDEDQAKKMAESAVKDVLKAAKAMGLEPRRKTVRTPKP